MVFYRSQIVFRVEFANRINMLDAILHLSLGQKAERHF
jgi:hypothetical protein